jgi:hypothetical protein
MKFHLISTIEYEASPPPENYYAREYNSDQFSPSPPHGSGGSYFPQSNSFPPPPTGAAYTPDPNFHYEPNTHLPPDNGPIPPYNPQDYAGQPTQANPIMTGGAGPAPGVRGTGEHVSTNSASNPDGFYGLRNNPTGVNLHNVPVSEQQYFSAPMTASPAPIVPQAPFIVPKTASEEVRKRELEEGAFLSDSRLFNLLLHLICLNYFRLVRVIANAKNRRYNTLTLPPISTVSPYRPNSQSSPDQILPTSYTWSLYSTTFSLIFICFTERHTNRIRSRN